MKTRGMMLAIAAAALGALPVTGAIVPSSSTSANAPSGGQSNKLAQPSTGQTAAARRMFTAGSGSGWGGNSYRRRPKRTVAQDKRDARRARNRMRTK